MAQSSGPNILEWLLLGGAAYLAYEWLFAPAATVAAAPTTTTTTTTGTTTAPATTSTPPAAVVSAPTMTAQLLAAATAAGEPNNLNADQWSYYWQQLGLPTINATTWQTIYFPNGRPATSALETLMTAAQYTQALIGGGVTGLSGMSNWARPITVPKLIFPRGRGFGAQYTLGDLRRAGRR